MPKKRGAITIELTQPHTHAGQQKQPGDRLTLPIAQAEWLMRYRIAKPAPNQNPIVEE